MKIDNKITKRSSELMYNVHNALFSHDHEFAKTKLMWCLLLLTLMMAINHIQNFVTPSYDVFKKSVDTHNRPQGYINNQC